MSTTTPISINTIRQHLRELVAADSSDPVDSMNADHPAILYAAHVLECANCEISITELGDGCVNLLATRGHPTTLFNCHLDTVKPNPSWTRDPFTLHVQDARAYGLGACDIKGAAACMLNAAQASSEPIAILFTTDEEAGKGKCVESFLKDQGQHRSRVVVAEPTNAKAVFQHRGFASFEIKFAGNAGHTSGANASGNSAIHKAIDWGHKALALAQPGGLLADARFNIGLIEGGTASNVIAASAIARFGFRPLPSPDAVSIAQKSIDALHTLLPEDGTATWTDRFVGPALVRDEAMTPIVEAWGIETGPDVDFWTEAALFAAGGLPAIVLGPGNIAQAHASDEYVELDQLEQCAHAYAQIVAKEAANLLTTEGAHAP